MDGRANAHHLPRGRDDQQRLAEEDERHARREYGRAAATLGYAQLLEEATASPVLKPPKLLCGHDPRPPAPSDTRHAVNRHAHVWHVQVTVCVLTPGLLRCVCVLFLTSFLSVSRRELSTRPPRVPARVPPAPGRGRVGTRPRSRSHRAGTSHDRYRRELPTRRARPRPRPGQRPGAPLAGFRRIILEGMSRRPDV